MSNIVKALMLYARTQAKSFYLNQKLCKIQILNILI